jgi:hypothetical protein
MEKKTKPIPFCKKHNRPMIPTRFICPNCMGSVTSPARRRAALNASKMAAKARTLAAKKKKHQAPKGGKSKAEGLDAIF